MTTETTARVVEQLTTRFAPDQCLIDAASCAAHHIQHALPCCVVLPASAAELAELLHIAQQQQIAIVPWGGGTQQWIGAPPATMPFVVVKTTRLNRVLIHEPADLTISVEAGMPLGELQRYLAAYSQMLPLDPPLADSATIGGLLATAADGPRRAGYGTLRDLLIGISVADVAGRITKAGGMVVKNVSGFDMMKLYHGSFGSLGIITSANFKLLPAPRAAGSLLCLFSGQTDAMAFLDDLHETQLTPVAVEYLNSAALHNLGREGRAALALRAEGLPAAVERHLRDLQRLTEAHHAHAELLHGDQAALFWQQIADLPQTKTLADDEALIKLSVLPERLDVTLSAIERLAETHHTPIAINARALNGVLYLRLQPATATLLQDLTWGGFQWCATPLAGVPHWGAPAGREVMQRLKHEFDPSEIFNPGRFAITSFPS